MNKQQYEEAKAILAGAPDGATHYLVNQYDFTEGYFKLTGQCDVLVDTGECGWGEIDFDVTLNGNHQVTDIASLKTICAQYERIEKLESRLRRRKKLSLTAGNSFGE